jgi:3-oxoacyl-[acyl-carrier-protein] synthase III
MSAIRSRARGHARILSFGAHRPDRIVSNEEICAYIDSSDEWIRTRSGIRTRRIADNESVPEMAARAGSKALSGAGVRPDEVSCVVVASMSYLYQAPPAAAVCAAQIGASTAGAFDIGAACAGFSHALAVASNMISAGDARYVVVAGAEKMSEIVDPRDRSTAFIFGDGAGAAVLGPAAEPGIGPVVWGTDTGNLDAIRQARSFAELRNGPESGAAFPYLEMAGPTVFRWAISALAGVARRALSAAGVAVTDLDAFIPHQANARIIDAVADQLGLREDAVVARTVCEDGNISAASIPMAADHLISTGGVQPGALCLTMGFGSGLGYSAQVVRMP